MQLFIDESVRKSAYLLCGVVFKTSQVRDARNLLMGLRYPGKPTIHFSKADQETRVKTMIALAENGYLEETVLVTVQGGSQKEARKIGMKALVHEIELSAVKLVTLDSVDYVMATSDKQAFARASMGHSPPSVRHVPYHTEPLLWAADGVAWCGGHRGEARKLVPSSVRRISVRP